MSDDRSTEELLRELVKDGMVKIDGTAENGEPLYSLTEEGERYALHVIERMRRKKTK